MKTQVFGKPLNEIFEGAWAWAGMIGLALLLAGAVRLVVSLLSGLEALSR